MHEDLLEHEAVAVFGPRGGVPEALRGKRLLRFSEDELAERHDQLLKEGRALVVSAAAREAQLCGCPRSWCSSCWPRT